MRTTPSPGPKFTLAQLLVTVTVIAVLTAIATPWVESMMKQGVLAVVLYTILFAAIVPGLTLGLGIGAQLSHGTKTATVFHLLSHGIGLLGSLGMMCTTVPVFERVFADFDAKLPMTTQLLIRVSDVAVRHWFLAVPAVLLVVAVEGWIFFLAHGHQPSRVWARLSSGIITALLVAAFATSFVALSLPLVMIVQKLTG